MSAYTPEISGKLYITTNTDDKTTTLLDSASFVTKPAGPDIAVSYAYSAGPTPSFTNDADFKARQEIVQQNQIPSFPSAGYSKAGLCTIAPNPNGDEGLMHRSNTLDYVYITSGETEYATTSGEKKILKKGDVIIQRAGWHAWKNTSKTEELTLFAVSIGAEGATEDFMEIP
ncbi:70d3ac4d-a280-4080-ad2b-ca4935406789-CDS [Sclerotinia trifoliorum]|uniref:70d3ac4d-a280-4080-ad2b-ca4935406789-CDS n=1 Tax=Sclerotinia trifoliorum TaxID=28548 RepID=A0A8H2W4V9_9HELO|nr:70d3ac4d-a280-4080-ad2b-ca4935406789-CDS [Sclerotinia trifoliorum]